jgi:type IV pilus assembly protein PilA
MSTIKCPQCGLTNWATSEFCKRCKLNFQAGESALSFDSGVRNEFAHNESQHHPNVQRFNQQQNFYTQPQKHQQKQGLAIASMVLGIVGFVGSCVGGFILAPFGLILGIVSLIKANKYPQTHGGKGFAISGVVLSGFMMVIFPIIAAIAIPNLLAARKSANEAAAISTLRKIANAQVTYTANVGAGECGDLTELDQNQLIDPVVAKGQKSGYRFQIDKIPSTTVLGAINCEVTAIPLDEGKKGSSISATGTRSFFESNEDGWQIHYSKTSGVIAKISDPSIDNNSFIPTPQNGSNPPQVSTNPKTQTRKH